MPTISYVKIYGPPVYDAIKELEKIAVDMPEVCILDTIIDYAPNSDAFSKPNYVSSYFQMIPVEVYVKRCNNIISKSGEKLGEYDFFFEWFKKPTMEQLNQLIKKIDKTLKPLGCSYTFTTKK
jgi:thiamine biosynthesis protein ThiC